MSPLQQILRITGKPVVPVPAAEFWGLLIILSICLIMSFRRIGLLVAFLFAYKWGWQLFAALGERCILVYLGFGLVMGPVAVMSMMRSRD